MLHWLWCWFALISRLSEIYSAYLPHDVLIFQFLRKYVICILLLYRFTLNIFPCWKRWVELKLLRAGHRRKESTQSKWRKRKHALGCYGRDCRRGIWRGLPAVLEASEHDSGGIKAVCSQIIYMYMYHLSIVDDAGRHDIDFGREGLIDDLSFFSY